MSKLPKDTEERLAAIVYNRLVAHRLTLADAVEPKIARPLLTAVDACLKEVKARLTAEVISDFQEQKLRKIQAWYSELQKDLTKQLTVTVPEINEDLAELAKTEAAVIGDILSFGGMATSIKQVGISTAVAEAIVNTPAGGALLKDWVARLGGDVAWKSYQALQQGIMQGETIRQMTKRLEAIGTLTRQHATTIVRTHVAEVANQAHSRVSEQNRDILEGSEWLGVLDNRRCAQCMPLEGTKWYYDPKPGQRAYTNMPRRPLHPRCRCMALDFTMSWSKLLGVELPEHLDAIEEKYRPYSIRERYKTGVRKGEPYQVGTGGAAIEEAGQFEGSAEKWLKAYPDVAREILGVARADLFLSGKVSLQGLMANPGKLMPVSELRRMAGIEKASVYRAKKWPQGEPYRFKGADRLESASKDWFDGLSSKERSALAKWTTSHHTMKERITTGELAPHDQDFLDAVMKAPRVTDVSWRGIAIRPQNPGDPETIAQLLKHQAIEPGEQLKWSVSSASLNPDVAANYATENGVIFEIRSTRGRYINGASKAESNEFELIFERNSSFIIRSVSEEEYVLANGDKIKRMTVKVEDDH